MNFDWVEAAPWIVAASIFMFVASLVALPIFLVSMPEDYFVESRPRLGWLSQRHPVVRLAFLLGKNVLGATLLVAGVIMLFVPGQGLITILAGIFFMDLPGKRRLERAILRWRGVLGALNSIRAKAGKPPFEVPHD